jgi:hypothetical protein
VLSGPLPRPRAIFDRARLEAKHPELRMADGLEEALVLAAELTTMPVPTPSKTPPPPSVPPRSERAA